MLGTQALERQKDFFDSIRSERDDLRDEVVVLKEQLKVCKRNKKNLYSSADPFPLNIWAKKLSSNNSIFMLPIKCHFRDFLYEVLSPSIDCEFLL